MSQDQFVDRIFDHVPPVGARFAFESWRHTGRPTNEAVGVLPSPSVDIDAMVARVLDVDHYVGNIDFVDECRTIEDPAHVPPESLRFYQRVKMPLLGGIHHELVMRDHGERDGWRVLAWTLHEGTDRLDGKRAARSEFNVGAWLLREDAVGYALSSSPRKGDVGRLKFAALTKGADASASKVLQANIEGMLRWSRR